MNGEHERLKSVASFVVLTGLLVMALLASGAEALAAQRRGPQEPGGGGQRQEMQRRIQARFDNLVREELALSDDQVQQLQDAVEDFRGRRVEFAQRERNMRGRMVGLGARGGGQELTDEEASEVLREMVELSGDEAALFREEQEEFLQILSPPQVVRFIVMRQRFGDRIRSLRGGGGPARGQQGRGPEPRRP